jgi:hypothetical protein
MALLGITALEQMGPDLLMPTRSFDGFPPA